MSDQISVKGIVDLLKEGLKKYDDKPDFYICYMDGVTDSIDLCNKISVDNVNNLLTESFVRYEDGAPEAYRRYIEGVTDSISALCGQNESKKSGSLYLETLSGRYLAITDDDLLDAEREMKRINLNSLYSTVNEWYEIIGLEHVEYGDELGWTANHMFSIDILNGKICYGEQPIRLFSEEPGAISIK